MFKKIIILSFVSLFFSVFSTGCTWRLPQPDGSIVDQSIIQTINYDNYWQYFQTTDGSVLHESATKITAANHDSPAKYLRNCGGLLPYGYVLADESDQTLTASTSALPAQIGTIKTPTEAVAWLYANTCNLQNNYNQHTQFVNQVNDGYLVYTIYYNWFGCGNHAHRLNQYFVSTTGHIELQNSTKLELGQEFCGD